MARKRLTLIYKSGVVAELTCDSYRSIGAAEDRNRPKYLTVVAPDPLPVTMIDIDELSAIYEGAIVGAHDRSDDDFYIEQDRKFQEAEDQIARNEETWTA